MSDNLGIKEKICDKRIYFLYLYSNEMTKISPIENINQRMGLHGPLNIYQL
jgi:hypothetical protein